MMMMFTSCYYFCFRLNRFRWCVCVCMHEFFWKRKIKIHERKRYQKIVCKMSYLRATEKKSFEFWSSMCMWWKSTINLQKEVQTRRQAFKKSCKGPDIPTSEVLPATIPCDLFVGLHREYVSRVSAKFRTRQLWIHRSFTRTSNCINALPAPCDIVGWKASRNVWYLKTFRCVYTARVISSGARSSNDLFMAMVASFDAKFRYNCKHHSKRNQSRQENTTWREKEKLTHIKINFRSKPE